MKHLLTISIFLIFTTGIKANSGKSIPGYLGNRNVVSLNILPNISLQAHNFPMMNLSIERATSRKTSYSLSFGHKIAIVKDYSINQFSRDLQVIYDGKPTYTNLDGELKYRQSQLTISRISYLSKYGSIAPMGKFIRFGYTLNLYKIIEDNMDYSLYTEFYQTVRFKNPENDFKTLNFGVLNLEFGSMRFLSRQLFVRKAMAFNFPLNYLGKFSGNTFNNINNHNESKLALYIAKTQMLNISLGIGYAF